MFSRIATLALFLWLTILSAPGVRATETFVAEMEVVFNDAKSMARLWAHPGRLRMSLQAGRIATGMLADYTQGKAWALIPGAHRYQAFPIDSLRATVPYFFRSRPKIRQQGDTQPGHCCRTGRHQIPRCPQASGRTYLFRIVLGRCCLARLSAQVAGRPTGGHGPVAPGRTAGYARRILHSADRLYRTETVACGRSRSGWNEGEKEVRT